MRANGVGVMDLVPPLRAGCLDDGVADISATEEKRDGVLRIAPVYGSDGLLFRLPPFVSVYFIYRFFMAYPSL